MQYLVPGIVIALVLIAGVVIFMKKKTAPAKKAKADPRHPFRIQM